MISKNIKERKATPPHLRAPPEGERYTSLLKRAEIGGFFALFRKLETPQNAKVKIYKNPKRTGIEGVTA